MVGRGVMWMELFTVMVFVMSVLMICFMVRVISVAVAMIMSGLLLILMVTIDHNSHVSTLVLHLSSGLSFFARSGRAMVLQVLFWRSGFSLGCALQMVLERLQQPATRTEATATTRFCMREIQKNQEDNPLVLPLPLLRSTAMPPP